MAIKSVRQVPISGTWMQLMSGPLRDEDLRPSDGNDEDPRPSDGNDTPPTEERETSPRARGERAMPLKFTNEELKNAKVVLGPDGTTVVTGTIRCPNTGEPHEAAVVFGPEGIEVRLDGYGEKLAADGQGTVVFVEVIDGKPQANVYANVNVEGPTHQIDLSAADERGRFDVGHLVEWSEAGVIRRGVIERIAPNKNPDLLVKPIDGETRLHCTKDPRWLLATQLRRLSED